MTEEVNEKQQQQGSADVQDVLERINREAGYDVATAFAALNAAVINEQSTFDFGMFEAKTDVAAVFDIVVKGRGGRLDALTMSMLMDAAVAYGWHWARSGESLLRSDEVRGCLKEFVEGNPGLTIVEKADRKRGLELGFRAIGDAVRRADERLRTARMVKGGRR